MEKVYESIGKRIPLLDAPAKATGQAKYTADISLPGMLSGKILYSPYPHARIINIDISKACRIKGVRAILTGRDTLGAEFGHMGADEQGIAVDRVRYIGEPVVIAAAEDEEAALEAIEAVKVEYEVLEPVFDPEAALEEGAPRIYDTVENNLSAKISRSWGNVEDGFSQAYLVREETFVTQAQAHCCLETHSAVADYSNGFLTVWSTTQGPFCLRKDLALLLGIQESSIRVIKPPVGGGFGGKRELAATDFAAAFAAMKTGRPVKVTFDREEEFYCNRQRHPMKIKLKLGMSKEGDILAKDCVCILDGGAHKSNGPGVVAAAARVLMTLFNSLNGRFLGLRAYTNNPVSGAFRGFGGLQVRFAEEGLIDEMAKELGLEPHFVRLKNAARKGETLPNGFTPISCGLAECIENTVKNSGFARRKDLPAYWGMGIACEDYVSGARIYASPDYSAAIVELNTDGTVKLLTGAADIGQGSDTTLAQIAAEVLGIGMDSIRVIAADTQATPYDEMGTYASRVTFVAGNAALIAAQRAKKEVANFIAEKWDCVIEELVFKNGSISLPVKGKKITLEDAVTSIFNEKNRRIMVVGEYSPGTERPNFVTGKGYYSPSYSYGAQVAQVQVDPHTGRVEVKKVTTAEDCGRAINPMSLEGQAEGSITCGMGMALFEERLMDKGVTLNPSFLDYKIPTVLEAPEVDSEAIETIDPIGPFGAKGVSEGYQVPTAPAIANAIAEAAGIRLKSLPMNPEKIWKSLREVKNFPG